MTTLHTDYSIFDLPEITKFLFHPRTETGNSNHKNKFQELMIPVGNSVTIGTRFYQSEQSSPNLLFFHGNGEIVADYDEISQLYHRMNVNFFPVDYRGYGKSSGNPSVSAMMKDSHSIFKYVIKWLSENEFTGPLIIMGRSLGSASALEIMSVYQSQIQGIIIESGFALTVPLLRLLGINTDSLGIDEEKGIGNFDKIKLIHKPTLVIHAENDQIIPFRDAQNLYDNSSDKGKKLLMIPAANHNDIFALGLSEYMMAVKTLIERAILEKQNNIRINQTNS